MANVMTYAQAIDRACEIIETFAFEPEELEGAKETMERLEALKAQLAKRGSHGPTKTQRENEVLRERIYEVLCEAEEGLTATEVANAVEVKVQKATPQLTKLLNEERVVKVKEGKVVRSKVA